MGILSGVRIIDATYGSGGPPATQLLADFGAEIVRIDIPSVDMRRVPGNVVRLRGRRGIAVDLTNAASLPLLERLVAGADVLISEAGFDGAGTFPLDYKRLEAVNPRLVFCRITAYGDEGPQTGLPANDHLVAARYGIYDQPGWRPGPTFMVPPIASLGAGYLAVQAIGAALYARERSGRGQEVSTSLLAGSLAFRPGMVRVETAPSGLQRPAYTAIGPMPFYSVYECGGGDFIHLGCLSVPFQKNAVKAMGLEEALADFPYSDAITTAERDAWSDIVAARLKEKTYAEWAALFEAHDVPHARAGWTEELLDDPQVRQQGLVVTIDDPLLGPVEQMGPVVAFSDEPYEAPRPAPLPGEHTDAVCSDLGLSNTEVTALRAAGAIG
jgi:formyl-CoA transferase